MCVYFITTHLRYLMSIPDHYSSIRYERETKDIWQMCPVGQKPATSLHTWTYLKQNVTSLCCYKLTSIYFSCGLKGNRLCKAFIKMWYLSFFIIVYETHQIDLTVYLLFVYWSLGTFYSRCKTGRSQKKNIKIVVWKTCNLYLASFIQQSIHLLLFLLSKSESLLLHVRSRCLSSKSLSLKAIVYSNRSACSNGGSDGLHLTISVTFWNWQ